MTTLTCPNCGVVDTPALAWRQFSNGTVHLGAACASCDRHLQWLPQTPEWVEIAPPLPAEMAAQRKEEGGPRVNGLIAACEGRLAADAELRFTANGQALLSFRMAVEEQRKDGAKAETQWVAVSCWGDRATELNEAGKLVKGAECYAEGRLTLRTWQDREGKERSGLNLSAWVVQPLGAIGKRGLVEQAQQGAPARGVVRDQVYRGPARSVGTPADQGDPGPDLPF